MELSRIITPIIYSQGVYLVYVIQIPLIQSTLYYLYKIQPFPVKQQDQEFVYIHSTKDFIFVDAMRRYSKMNYQNYKLVLNPMKLLMYVRKLHPLSLIPQKKIVKPLSFIHPQPLYQKDYVSKES
jgi:hypothetical protein